MLGVEPDEVGLDGGPGNRTLFRWFRKANAAMGHVGNCSVLVDGDAVQDWSANERVFRKVRMAVRHEHQVVICHRDNHYNLVCGYFENSDDPAEAFGNSEVGERWLILRSP